MPVIARDKLLDDLRRSGLIDEERLKQFLADHQPDADAEFLLQKLVDAGLLTPWQSESLLAGKWKGFFLGKYRLLHPLGMGAMGSVFLAEHRVMRHRVAIKVLAKHLMEVPNIVSRFEREARAAAVINHPNVVRAFDIDSEGNVHFLVMEYVQGEDLKKIVEQNGPLDPRVAAEYAQQVARGLHEAHKNGLVHRDIKPANLLLDQSGLVKVLDLGLARLEDEATASVTLMSESRVLGTVDYLAPEQALNSHNIDGRADLYSLGCTLYFLLTGVPPFPTGSIAERMIKHQTRRPVDLRKRRPGVPDALVNICNRLMEKQPDKRFATAGDAAIALGEFLEGRYHMPGDDDLLSFAEDADSGGPSSSKSGQSSNSRRPGSSSTAPSALQSSHTVRDDLDLAPEAVASKSSSKVNLSATPALPPLGSSLHGLDPAAPAADGLTPLGSGAHASLFDQLPPLTPTAGSGVNQSPLDALQPLGGNLADLDALGGNPLLSSGPQAVANNRPPAEVQRPLWVLIGIGVALGLVVAGVGTLLYFVFR